MERTVAVIGGGVAGLAAASHLVELWEAHHAEGRPPAELHLRLLAPLVPTGGDGSGLGGKAMSRSFEGPADAHGNLRRPMYGPMMPHKGTVPHGYHVLWAYPNLRRLLGDGAPDEPSPALDGGLLRPRGGAGALSVFQGLISDPAPGGPGIALMGLSDPQHPETATQPATQALYRLQGTRLAGLFLRPMATLFARLAGGIDPLFFADLFYTHEVDLELRLALIAASLVARRTDPERTTVDIDGQRRHLWELEYDAWLDHELASWARPLLARLDAPPLRGWQDELQARAWLLECQVEDEGEPGGLIDRALRALLPQATEQHYQDARLVTRETERILRAIPAAVRRLASGEYRVGDTLHLRFGPDATFTSPHSYDAASAVRSLAFVFTSPRSARCWTADGARMHRLWLRLWQRLEARVAATDGRVRLERVPGRATSLSPLPGDGPGVEIGHAPIVGHAFGPPSDLGWPHTERLAPWRSSEDRPVLLQAEVAISAMAPTSLLDLLPATASPARQSLLPLEPHHNSTLEIVLWLRRRLVYSETARKGLAGSSITGLEGGWCLLADYSQGLWSEEALAQEDPFSEGGFAGSVLESCGSFDDLFACLDRDDAFGWPAEVKQTVADLLCRPALFDRTDERPWPADEAGWRARRAAGQWTEAHAADPSSMEDWFVASRWMAWQLLRQLACIQSLGPQAVRALGHYASLLDPRGRSRQELLQPPAALRGELRYVVMRNAKPRNRIFSPSAGTWPQRPVSGQPLPGLDRVFPAGDWTRNGLDVICMEAATLSGMRAARGAYRALTGQVAPTTAPGPVAVMPPASWYTGLDPLKRGQADAEDALANLGVGS